MKLADVAEALPAVTAPNDFVSVKIGVPTQVGLFHRSICTVPPALAVNPLTVATSWIVPAGSWALVADVTIAVTALVTVEVSPTSPQVPCFARLLASPP